MKWVFAALGFALLLFLVYASNKAHAHIGDCISAKMQQEYLEKEFGEKTVNLGLSHDRKTFLYQLYRAEDGETWTMLVVHRTKGYACVLASGINWVELTPDWGKVGVDKL